MCKSVKKKKKFGHKGSNQFSTLVTKLNLVFKT